MSQHDYLKGYRTGVLNVSTAIRDLLENSENRISILSILELLERKEAEVEAALAAERKAGR